MNLANKLTVLRIILVPVFLFFILVNVPYGAGKYVATGVFVVAALTDTLDGYIARKKNQVTKFGKFLDPLADKLLVAAALISLVEMKKLSTVVVMIIIAREFAITGLRAIAASEGIVIAASPWGKAKTVTQIVAIIAALLEIPYNEILIAVAVLITLMSGIDYLYKNRKVINTRN